MKPLRNLERRFVLPDALDRRSARAKNPRGLGEPVESASNVPEQASDVCEITVIRAQNRLRMCVRSELMSDE